MKGIRQREKAAKVMSEINNSVTRLLNEQRAKLEEFAKGEGDYAELKQEELLARVHSELGQGAYAILNEALGKFGLKAPDEAMMKNLEYVRNNQEALREVVIESGADDKQVQEALNVADNCFAAMEGLWGKAEEVAKILVEGDIKEQQKAQALLYGGIALATMSAASVGGAIASIVFTAITLARGGMFPMGLFFGSIFLAPVLIASFGSGAVVALHESESVIKSQVQDVKKQVSEIITDQVNSYEKDAKELEKVQAQVGEMAEKLKGVPQELEAAIKGSQQQRY